MTKKKQRRVKAKEIRKATGIPFVKCFAIGKAEVNGFDGIDWDDFSSEFKNSNTISYPCGDGCCSGEKEFYFEGPKGIWYPTNRTYHYN